MQTNFLIYNTIFEYITNLQARLGTQQIQSAIPYILNNMWHCL